MVGLFASTEIRKELILFFYSPATVVKSKFHWTKGKKLDIDGKLLTCTNNLIKKFNKIKKTIKIINMTLSVLQM